MISIPPTHKNLNLKKSKLGKTEYLAVGLSKPPINFGTVKATTPTNPTIPTISIKNRRAQKSVP